jgi:hypothetical protein
MVKYHWQNRAVVSVLRLLWDDRGSGSIPAELLHTRLAVPTGCGAPVPSPGPTRTGQTFALRAGGEDLAIVRGMRDPMLFPAARARRRPYRGRFLLRRLRRGVRWRRGERDEDGGGKLGAGRGSMLFGQPVSFMLFTCFGPFFVYPDRGARSESSPCLVCSVFHAAFACLIRGERVRKDRVKWRDGETGLARAGRAPGRRVRM